MAAAMVSEGGSGSRRWSGALREIPGLSGVPCLARATSGTPSAGLRDIPDRTWLPQTPPLRPLPRTQSCQGPKFWGRHWVGGKVSNTASVGSYSGFGLRILWLPFPSFHFPALISLKSPQLFPPSLLPLTSRPCSPPPHCLDQSADASSPLTNLPAQILCQIFSRALSSPVPSAVPTAHLSWLPIPGSMPLPPPPRHPPSPDSSLIISPVFSQLPASLIGSFYPTDFQT